MAEGRRHSVDVPLSKTLVALKRVRSLRDPDTNPMGRFTAALDNGGAFIDFSSPDVHSEHMVQSRNHGNPKVGSEDAEKDSGPDGKLRAPHNRRTAKSKQSSAVVLRHPKKTRTKVVHGLDFTFVPQSGDLLEEEVESCCGQSFQLPERVNTTVLKNSGYGILMNQTAAAEESLTSRAGTPCMSLGEAHTDGSSRCILGLATEEVDMADSTFSGCGISYCWSRTPKYRDSNLGSDAEDLEHPLLSADGREMVYRDPYSETPRSLSQKFRPKSFTDLVGLNVVVKSLSYAIAKGKVAPMYLFHGPRGTGKTSTARIFAASLNCLSLEEYRPCGFCQECMFLFSGKSRDVKELDAAKVNHKNRVKALLKSASLVPFSSSFKVFIIDECQNLRGEIWAAILSSLEEVSRHSVFVMITSDPDKLPHSCASHCQRYHFSKIKESDVVCRLQKLCIEEGLEFDMDALEFIALKSNGSLRDAETLLDQLALLGKRITLSLAYELIGVVSDDELLNLLDLALSSDTANTVRRARELMGSRVDPMQLISQLADLIMDILAGRRQSGFLEAGRKFFGRDSLRDIDLHILRHALKVLSETEKQLRTSKNQATWLTAALLQFNTGESSPMDAIDSKGLRRDNWVQSTSSSGESSKNYVCYVCNNKKSSCIGRRCNKSKLESIWRRAIGKCESSSLKSFLLKDGILSSIFVNEGCAFVEVEFYRPDHVSRAEKSRKLITESLQCVLGCNFDIRIKLIPANFRKNGKVKKPSFSLLSCSGRKQEMSDSTTDENETSTSVTRETCDEVHSSHVGEQLSPSIQQQDAKRMHQSSSFHDKTITITNVEEDVRRNGMLRFKKPAQDEMSNGCKLESSNDICEMGPHFNAQEPDIQPSCFARTLKLQRRLLSTDVAHTIHLKVEPHKLEQAHPKKATFATYFCTYDPYSLCSRSDTHVTGSSGEDNVPSKSSRISSNFLCWRASKPPNRKVC